MSEVEMKAFLIKTLTRLSLLLGSWPIRFIAWWITTGYFLFRPERRRASIFLYQTIFPARNTWYHRYCAWRQFHSFSATYGDRIDFDREKGVNISTQGDEGIREAAKEGKGGIILISHLGSFEIAARGFRETGRRHLMIMGEKEAKQVARDQRENLKAQGIEILVASGEEDSLYGGIEALRFLREGGFVSLAGDIVWTDPRSLVLVRLFDREVGLPAGPHLLSLVSGAPLFFLFTFRMARGKHQIILQAPRYIRASSRSERKKAIQESAQAYANALEEIVRQHPFQWYIFEPFFRTDRADKGMSASGHAPAEVGRKQEERI